MNSGSNISHTRACPGGGRTEFNIPQPSKARKTFRRFRGWCFRIGCDFHTDGVVCGVFEHPFHMTSNNGGKYELRLPSGKYVAGLA